MEHKQEKRQTLTRLALCVILAAVIYVGLSRFGDKLPLPEQCGPWLEKNKVQAIAILAAILFGLSLAVFPPKKAVDAAPTPEECDPCAGYERTGDLP